MTRVKSQKGKREKKVTSDQGEDKLREKRVKSKETRVRIKGLNGEIARICPEKAKDFSPLPITHLPLFNSK
ncbi:MAG: hypothetical protein OQK59_00790 [Chlorobium sp.]|nr:hypothetical protein [Chlorobium sp.]